MINNYASSVSCFGCEKKCTYASDFFDSRYASEQSLCPALPFFIWPATNSWLCLGISTLIENISFHGAGENSRSVVFIDFSIGNFSCFISDNWLWNFKNSMVVFIVDSSMTSFANYWFDKMRSLDISGSVIYAEDEMPVMIRKLISISNGKVIAPKNKMQRITISEFTMLQLLYRGVSPKRMATFCQTSVNTIYANKSKIEKKFKCKIKRLPRACSI